LRENARVILVIYHILCRVPLNLELQGFANVSGNIYRAYYTV
jgi:hypothetical protein